jgi:acyl-CoA synthetase (AMP-forming)/AMP-acid ligase II
MLHLTQALTRAVQQWPRATATVFGERRRCYAQLGERVARLAGALSALGVRPGDRVGLLALNSDYFLEWTLACWWAGGVLNPVNTRWSASEVAFCLTDSGTQVLVIDVTHLDLLEGIRLACPGLQHVVLTDEAAPTDGLLGHEVLVNTSPALQDSRCGEDSLAGIFYTGGTTGRPKGVMLTHRNLLVSSLGFLACGHDVGEDVALHVAPLFHMAGMSVLINSMLTAGRHVFLPSFEPATLMSTIAAERVTHLFLVPTMLQRLIDHPEFGQHDLSSLKRVQYAASPMTLALLERALSALPGVHFVHAYGMTELAPHATLLPDVRQAHLWGPAGRSLSAGRPLPHVELRIVDEQDAEVARGCVGEIVVRGPNVMQGYWRRPQETTQALRGGWMHTGDLGRMDEDGLVHVVDRLKDMVITGGENVYPAEVENVLSQHRAVASCAVIGVPSTQWGEAVHAVVVLRAGMHAEGDELIAHCRQTLARYKCPRSVEFVPSLPLSASAKVLKAQLRARHQPAPAGHRQGGAEHSPGANR